ncbi:hypothetical protein C8R46DRAFT_1185934 [Mycena filopes]|nr:hypothetical protein C8R46DRAFT_1185934 [Mycena filopes]
MASPTPPSLSAPATPKLTSKRAHPEAFGNSPLTPLLDDALPLPGRPSSPSEAHTGSRMRIRKAAKSESDVSVRGSAGVPPSASDASDSGGFGPEFEVLDEDGSESGERLELSSGSEQDSDDFGGSVDYTVEDEKEGRREPVGSPKKRVPPGASVKTEAKKLALAVDPNQGRCLITGQKAPKSARQWAHVARRTLKPHQLRTLEWMWGLKFFSLYIDTKFNLTPLMANWHLPLDAGDWALVPHHALITKIKAWVDERGLQEKRGPENCIDTLFRKSQGVVKTYNYFILPLNDALENVPLYRLVGKEFDPNTREQRHVFPFNKVGPLTSHARPHFAIYTAGAKLAEVKAKMAEGKQQLEADHEAEFQAWLNTLSTFASFGHGGNQAKRTQRNLDTLQDVQDIYAAWTNHEGVSQCIEKNPKWSVR